MEEINLLVLHLCVRDTREHYVHNEMKENGDMVVRILAHHFTVNFSADAGLGRKPETYRKG